MDDARYKFTYLLGLNLARSEHDNMVELPHSGPSWLNIFLLVM